MACKCLHCISFILKMYIMTRWIWLDFFGHWKKDILISSLRIVPLPKMTRVFLKAFLIKRRKKANLIIWPIKKRSLIKNICLKMSDCGEWVIKMMWVTFMMHQIKKWYKTHDSFLKYELWFLDMSILDISNTPINSDILVIFLIPDKVTGLSCFIHHVKTNVLGSFEQKAITRFFYSYSCLSLCLFVILFLSFFSDFLYFYAVSLSFLYECRTLVIFRRTTWGFEALVTEIAKYSSYCN